MITGPGSPSVLSNMAVSIEQHVDWIVDCLDYLARARLRDDRADPAGRGRLEPARRRTARNITLYPTANSWYMGANVPGKPRVFLPYIGGVDAYRAACDEVVARGYLGFTLAGPERSQCHDGVIRRLQPDVAMVLEAMAALDLPPIESMSVEDARAFMAASTADAPPGARGRRGRRRSCCPARRGTSTTGCTGRRPRGPTRSSPTSTAAGGCSAAWTPTTPSAGTCAPGPDAIIVSVNYRHAPEAPFPGRRRRRLRRRAVDRGHTPPSWAGSPGQLAVAGWSAGGNLAAVACQLARDAGGPEILGQLLVTPVTDCDLSRPSYQENGDGYVLTAPLMHWFWDHYADPADRRDPKASPLRGDLSDLPPAVIVTAEFDPLRDEGRGLRRGPGGRRRARSPPGGPGPHPHLADHGRRGAFGGRRAGPDGGRARAASFRPRSAPERPGAHRRPARTRPRVGGPGCGR